MPNIKIDSGRIHFNSMASPDGNTSPSLKMLVLANLSGRNGLPRNSQDLHNRRAWRLDKDNFDTLFSKMAVKLSLADIQEEVQFDEFDDLTPDFLYENLPLFAQYRQLIRNLQSKDRYDAAVASLQREGLVEDIQSTAEAPMPEQGSTGSLLDSVFGASKSAAQTQAFSVQDLIRDTVAPYVESKADPRKQEYVAAVEQAAADALRSVLHCREFRSVESNWRSLDLLNRRLDTDRACQLHVVDVGVDELLSEAEQYRETPEESALFRLIAENTTAGSRSYDLIVWGDLCDQTGDVSDVYGYLSGLAKASEAQLIVGLDTQAFGIDQLVADGTSAKFEVSADWQTIQNRHFQGLFCAPRYMVRLPYGSRTKPIDNIRFEEVRGPGFTEDYLWGSSAYLVTLAIALAHQEKRVAPGGSIDKLAIGQLPVHVTVDQEGDELIVPPTEFYLTERVVMTLLRHGITPVQSVKNSDSVVVAQG